jgi:hypothetical protein
MEWQRLPEELMISIWRIRTEEAQNTDGGGNRTVVSEK